MAKPTFCYECYVMPIAFLVAGIVDGLAFYTWTGIIIESMGFIFYPIIED